MDSEIPFLAEIGMLSPSSIGSKRGKSQFSKIHTLKKGHKQTSIKLYEIVETNHKIEHGKLLSLVYIKLNNHSDE